MSSIAHWPASERPRERLLAHGAHALTDAELIAIVLGAGNAGVGPARAAKLKAGVELARRLLREEMSHGDALTSRLCERTARLI